MDVGAWSWKWKAAGGAAIVVMVPWIGKTLIQINWEARENLEAIAPGLVEYVRQNYGFEDEDADARAHRFRMEALYREPVAVTVHSRTRNNRSSNSRSSSSSSSSSAAPEGGGGAAGGAVVEVVVPGTTSAAQLSAQLEGEAVLAIAGVDVAAPDALTFADTPPLAPAPAAGTGQEEATDDGGRVRGSGEGTAGSSVDSLVGFGGARETPSLKGEESSAAAAAAQEDVQEDVQEAQRQRDTVHYLNAVRSAWEPDLAAASAAAGAAGAAASAAEVSANELALLGTDEVARRRFVAQMVDAHAAPIANTAQAASGPGFGSGAARGSGGGGGSGGRGAAPSLSAPRAQAPSASAAASSEAAYISAKIAVLEAEKQNPNSMRPIDDIEEDIKRLKGHLRKTRRWWPFGGY